MGAGNHRLGVCNCLDTVVLSNQGIHRIDAACSRLELQGGRVLDLQTEAAVDGVCRREATRGAPGVGKALKVRLRWTAEAIGMLFVALFDRALVVRGIAPCPVGSKRLRSSVRKRDGD